jgi:iron(III) transport system ATP-binding protein
VAGLESPDAGTIRFGHRVIFDGATAKSVATHRRGVGLVFQSFALWPHMTAYRNIEFPLRSIRLPRAEREARVAEVARMVDLSPALLNHTPGKLSGGQQQRVALARALVGRPDVLLFDEPLSNLDAHLRSQLRAELHLLHQRLGFTAIYVTHDLNEALGLGDKIAVMHRGRMAQIGTPVEVFEHPETRETARLVGFYRIPREWPESRSLEPEEMFVRPERIKITPLQAVARPQEVVLKGFRVVDLSYLGQFTETTLRWRDHDVQVRSPVSSRDIWWKPGDNVSVSVDRADIRVFGAAGSAATAVPA